MYKLDKMWDAVWNKLPVFIATILTALRILHVLSL